MRRLTTLVLAVLLAFSALGVAGCKRELVEVQDGTQTVCTYGEVVSEDVQTLNVPSSDASKYSVKTTIVTCPRHSKLEALYAQAQKALAKGDTKAAAKALAEIVAIDRTYRKAAEQADAIAKGKKPAPDTGESADESGTPSAGSGGGSGGGSGDTGSDDKTGDGSDSEPAGPTVNLTHYVPDTIPGFTALAIISDPLSLSRMYRPTSGGDVGSLVIAADQFKDSAQAQRMLVSRVQMPYPASAGEVVLGSRRGYFGTDGHRFAVVAFRDGAAVVVIEMMSKSGNPVSLKDELLDVAAVVF